MKLILLILILNINLEFYGEGSNLGRTIIYVSISNDVFMLIITAVVLEQKEEVI